MFSPVERFTRLLHRPDDKRDLVNREDRSSDAATDSEVLARVAHELRQPLSAALAAFHVLRSSTSESLRRRAGSVMDTQFTRMSRLVDDLSEATRLRPSLQVQRLDLRTVVREVAEAIAPEVAQKHQRLTIDLPSGPVWVSGDWVRLQQVMSNLMLNGVKHTDSGGLLQVAVTHQPGHAVLTVSDTGHGIDRKLMPHIFEPFIKGTAASSEGLGIGLTVVRQLVELHQGTIRAASAGLKCGSQFVVRLPISAETPLTKQTNVSSGH